MKQYVLTDGDNLIIVNAKDVSEALRIGDKHKFKHKVAKELSPKVRIPLEVEFRGMNGNYIKL